MVKKANEDEFLHGVLQDIYEFEGDGAVQEADGTISFRGFNQKTIDSYFGAKGEPSKPVNELKHGEAMDIFKDEFFNRNGINKIKDKKLLAATLDFAFNSGPTNATQMLQRAAGVPEEEVDGIIGPDTLRYIKESKSELGPDGFLDMALKAREAFLINSEEPGVVDNLDGLLNRVENIRKKFGGNRKTPKE